MPTCPVLTGLARELWDEYHSGEQQRRRALWTAHFAGQTSEIPVSCAMFQGWQDLVWQQILPEETFHYRSGLARIVEMHLRHTLWRARSIPDDTPIQPSLRLSVLPDMAPDELWGVPLAFHSTGMAGGAYKPVPPLDDPDDLAKLRAPEFRHDPERMARQAEELDALVGDLVPVSWHCDALHNGPFEWAVRLRGMDNLLFDCYDRPEWLKQLMDFLSRAMVKYHRAREAAGFVDAAEPSLHSPGDTVTPGLEKRLAGAWGYLHAQSAASYGPDTYAEFVHPYNIPIAELWGKVYYHGCEDLTAKAATIRGLPNLREFHVSPWSQVAPIAECLPEQVVLEVHSHPTNVLLLWGEDEMRQELRVLASGAGNHLFNLKLCDIQTINADAGRALISWSRVAREVATWARS